MFLIFNGTLFNHPCMKIYLLRSLFLLFLCRFAVSYGQPAQDSVDEYTQFELATEPGSYIYMNGVYQGVVSGQGTIRLAANGNREHFQLRIENPDFRSYEQTISTNSVSLSDPFNIPLTPVGGSLPEFNAFYLYVLAGVALLLILFTAGRRFMPEITEFLENRARPGSKSKTGTASQHHNTNNPEFRSAKSGEDFADLREQPVANVREENIGSRQNEKNIEEGERFGKYTISTKIAEGGVAKIYEAANSHDERVALKVMTQYLHDEDMVNKFIGEGWALQQIKKKFPDSPVIHVFDYGRKDGDPEGVPYIAMELVEGRSLNFFIQNNVLGYDQKIELLRQLVYAIDTAHQCKVLHRDLSPDNILIRDTPEFDMRLIDFGVARHEVHWLKGTSVGAAFGKPEYMAPEQIEGGDLDHTVDYYSLGVLIYALFTGRPPYQDDVMYKVFDMHINADIPEMPDHVPENIQNLVHSLMKKDPRERPQNIEQIMEKLK